MTIRKEDSQEQAANRQLISRRAIVAALGAGVLAGCGENNPETTEPQSPAATGTPTRSDTPTEGGNNTPTSTDSDTPTAETAAVLWETATDWNAAQSETGLVHEPWATAGDAAVQLGYSTNTEGLLSHYPLNDTPEDEVQEVVGDYSGRINGTIDVVEGLHNGRAWQFGDGYIAVDNPPVIPAGQSFTCAFWLRTTASGLTFKTNYLFEYKGGSSRIGITYNRSGQLLIDTAEHDTLATSGETPVNDGEWHYIVTTVDQPSGTVRQYVDGELDAETPNYGDTVDLSSGRAAIGSDVAGEKTLDGAIDEFQVYKRALTAERIADLYKAATHGRLRTATKRAPGAMTPNLTALDYALNDGRIELEIVGDPEGNREERITVELDGDSTYDLDWKSVHTAFNVQATLETPSPTKTPVLRRIGLSE